MPRGGLTVPSLKPECLNYYYYYYYFYYHYYYYFYY